MNNVTTRPAAQDDAEATFALLTQFVTSYAPQRTAFDRHFPILVSSGQSIFLVAACHGKVVGYALGSVSLTLYANGPVVELQELMVAPDHRRRGIGSKLVEAVLEDARRAGCTEATVPTRRATSFYVGLGFEETATYLKRRLAS